MAPATQDLRRGGLGVPSRNPAEKPRAAPSRGPNSGSEAKRVLGRPPTRRWGWQGFESHDHSIGGGVPLIACLY